MKKVWGGIYRVILTIKSLFSRQVKIDKIQCSTKAKIEIPFTRKDRAQIRIGKIIMNDNSCINIRKNANFEVEDGTFFNNNCIVTCREKIKIGKNCLFGPNVMIFDHDHDIHAENVSTSFISKPIIIEDNVWVGANTVILKGVRIGQGAVIAAGSVVNVDVEDYVIFYNQRTNMTKKIQNVSKKSEKNGEK